MFGRTGAPQKGGLTKVQDSGCRNAIHSVRKTVERLTKGNNTVNICSLDFSKAFDKVNHYGLCIKLMKRLIPVVLLEVLENWLSGFFFVCQVA